jgi:acetyl esterase/lipase
MSLHAPPPDARIPYGPEAAQFADLRVPDGLGPHPVVVVLHGGWWRAENDLEHLGPACAALTAQGAATWNVEYRSVGHPGGTWPTPLADAVVAVRRLAALAEPRLDLRRVLVLGFSAGGQLALRLAGALATGAADVTVCGAVSLAGVLDLRAAADANLGSGAVAALLGGLPAEVPGRYVDASPLEQPHLPVRQVIVHGSADASIPVAMSAAYAAVARARGDSVDLRVVGGASHFDPIDPTSAAWAVVASAVRDLLARSAPS